MEKDVSGTKINDILKEFDTVNPESLFYENTRHIVIPNELNNNMEGQDLFRFMEALTDDEDLEMIYLEGASGKMDAIYRTEKYALKVGRDKEGKGFAKFYIIVNNEMKKLKI